MCTWLDVAVLQLIRKTQLWPSCYQWSISTAERWKEHIYIRRKPKNSPRLCVKVLYEMPDLLIRNDRDRQRRWTA